MEGGRKGGREGLPEVLVKVGVGDLLEGRNVVDGDEVRVEVHVLNGDLREGGGEGGKEDVSGQGGSREMWLPSA